MPACAPSSSPVTCPPNSPNAERDDGDYDVEKMNDEETIGRVLIGKGISRLSIPYDQADGIRDE